MAQNLHTRIVVFSLVLKCKELTSTSRVVYFRLNLKEASLFMFVVLRCGVILRGTIMIYPFNTSIWKVTLVPSINAIICLLVLRIWCCIKRMDHFFQFSSHVWLTDGEIVRRFYMLSIPWSERVNDYCARRLRRVQGKKNLVWISQELYLRRHTSVRMLTSLPSRSWKDLAEQNLKKKKTYRCEHS